MKRGAAIAVGVLAFALVATFVAVGATRAKRPQGKEVRSEKVEARRIETWVRAPGEVRPARLVEISSNVMGRVEEVRVKEGERVNRGDLLLRLDDERYRSAAAQTRARLDAAQANLAVARATADLSKQTLARKERLAAERLISPEELEQVKTQAAVDVARYDAANEDLRSLRAGLAEVEKDLRETVFTAPMDGIVTALNIETGENVITGTMNNPGTVILVLADLDTMLVETEVDETDVVRLAIGQATKVTVDALPDTILNGRVLSIGQSGRRSSGSSQGQGISFLVRVKIDDPPSSLRPGMTADVEVLAAVREEALAVPIQALVAYPEPVVERWETRRARGNAKSKKEDDLELTPADTTGRRAKLVEGIFIDRDKTARFVRVKLSTRGDTHVAIEGEVTAGDRVITGPYRTLRALKDGDRVQAEKKKKSLAGAGGDEAK